MPRYIEDESGSPTQLRVGDAWPKGGGPAYAGNSHGWVLESNVSKYWNFVDFSKKPGIYTIGIDTCSALIYLFGPSRSSQITHAALWHVNCSTYSNAHTPEAAQEVIANDDLELKEVVIGYNQSKRGVKFLGGVKERIVEFKQFLAVNRIKKEPWIYVGNSEMFGIDKHAYVGMPIPMVTDTISSRRQRTGYEKLSVNEAKAEQVTTCCSKCFITTAVCQSLSLRDDCEELKILRKFRDNIMLSTSEGRADVEKYYAIAPHIVASINADARAAVIYAQIYAHEIVPILATIRMGNNDQARQIYANMIERLQQEYL